MAKVKVGGNVFHTLGTIPQAGESAPDFKLVTKEMSNVSLDDFKGSRLVLNIFPSLDTSTCAQSVRRFNTEVANLANTKVLCISKDTPFAQARFCGAEGLENVITLSDLRDGSFGKNYQLEFTDGPLEGFLSRVVVILDEQGKVIYSQQVEETADEPDYNAALSVL